METKQPSQENQKDADLQNNGGAGQAPTDNTPPDASKPPEQANAGGGGKARKVRVLVDCAHGKTNDVVELDAATLKAAEAAGEVDANAAAVKYALSLKS